MDAFVTTALIGTAQQPQQQDTAMLSGTPVDTLTRQLPGGEIERKLLLSAGAWAIYQQAGQVAEVIPTIVEPAARENLPTCSAAIATLLENMLKGEKHNKLLPEALERIQRAGLRIPHELLPTALDIQGKELQAAMFPLLGERGRWLSRFNPAWSWVANYLPGGEETQLADAETTWQEGTSGQRKKILRLLRAADPARAREWLAATWKQEKAEARVDLLDSFQVGLSRADEEFLEKALDDRSAGVRSLAASLLARIPTSALASRMQERADAILSCSAKTLMVNAPTEIGPDWQRDGIIAKPPAGFGMQTYWLSQVLSLVPPTHWEEHFEATPARLIEWAYANDQWSETLIIGWSKAAMLYKCSEWIQPLWDCCYQHSGTSVWDIHVSLLACMSPQESERRMLKIIRDANPTERNIWEQALATLPKPWSREFGEAYLQELRSYVSSLVPRDRTSFYYDSWYQSLSIAVTALPPACFASALEHWVVPKVEDKRASWQIEYWSQELHKFTKALRIRQRIIEETADEYFQHEPVQ